MTQSSPKRTLNVVADQLRQIVLKRPDGALIGSEDTILELLSVSRSTARQVARVLEREGLLRVKRGAKGGYFGARPNAQTIENTVSAYLQSLHVSGTDVMVLASVLWIEAMRKAAGMGNDEARKAADRIRTSVMALKPTASFEAIREVEVKSRQLVFKLADSAYIELIFNINTTFAIGTFRVQQDAWSEEKLVAFGRSWRDAKLMEATAIREGDSELGALAARHTREVWHRGVWQNSGLAS